VGPSAAFYSAAMPLVAGLVAAVLAAAPAPGPGVPVPAARVRASVTEILRGREYQTSLPAPLSPPTALPIPAWLARVLAWLARVLLYAGLGTLAAIAARWAFRALSGRPREGRAVDDPATPGAPPPFPIAWAEAAAAAGRFADAIHLLLLETLEALSHAARLAPSLTSREILRRVALGPRARDALAGLVLAVELSRFGGATPAAGDYRECLDRFHVFLETYRSRA
jgi:Domain of unknown function (DUF4129)